MKREREREREREQIEKEDILICLGRERQYKNSTIAHSWCDSHSTSISAYGVWGINVEVQVSMRELYTHIHLDWIRVEFLSCIKNKK